MTTRRENWDIVKFYLIFLVVLGHILDSYTDKSNLIRTIHLFIYSFHMPLFLFVSGLLTSRLDKKKMIKKSSKMLLYYLLAQIIFSLNKYISSGQVNFQLSQIGTWPWYIFSLAIFIIISYLLQDFNKKAVIVVSIAVSIIAGYFDVIYMKYSLSRILVFFPFFYMGYILSIDQIEKAIDSRKNTLYYSTILILLIVMMYIFIGKIDFLIYVFKGMYPYSRLENYLENYKLLAPFLRLSFYAISTVISALFLLAIANIKDIYLAKAIGQSTLTIYLLHFSLIILIERYIMLGGIDFTSAIYVLVKSILLTIIILVVLSLAKIFKKID